MIGDGAPVVLLEAEEAGADSVVGYCAGVVCLVCGEDAGAYGVGWAR